MLSTEVKEWRVFLFSEKGMSVPYIDVTTKQFEIIRNAVDLYYRERVNVPLNLGERGFKASNVNTWERIKDLDKERQKIKKINESKEKWEEYKPSKIDIGISKSEARNLAYETGDGKKRVWKCPYEDCGYWNAYIVNIDPDTGHKKVDFSCKYCSR